MVPLTGFGDPAWECRTNAWATASLASRFQIRSWTTEEGLPQNTVTCLLQSRDGYLWVGTLDGLARFDGLRFKVFDQQNTPAFRNHGITALAEYPVGCLWIGTVRGLLQYSNYVFRWLPLTPRLPTVRAIAAARTGGLWLGTDEGLLRLASERVVTFPNYPTWEENGKPGNKGIEALTEDSTGTLWLGDHRGLVRLKPGAQDFEVLYAKDAATGDWSSGALRLVVAADNSIWFGNCEGLFHYRPEGLRCFPLAPNGFQGAPLPLLTDRAGQLWIARDGFGLSRWEAERLVHFSKPTGLSEDHVRCLLRDREGNYWAGTQARGLNLLEPRKLTCLTTAEGLPHDNTWSIAQGPDDILWLGTDGGLCGRGPDGACRTYPLAGRAAHPAVTCVLATRSGTVWAGTELGLCRLQGAKLVPVSAEIAGVRYKLPVQSLFEEASGALWVGSGNLFRLKEGRWSQWGPGTDRTGDHVLPHPTVLATLQDSRGAVWVGTRAGVARFQEERWERFTAAKGFPAQAAAPRLADADGTMWFASDRGLIRGQGTNFFLISRQQGLFEDLVYDVLEDQAGWLWLNGNQGLQRVKKADAQALAEGRLQRLEAIRYGVADGMLSAEGNGEHSPGSCKSRDGRLWFPTTRGVVVVDPRKLNENTLPPLVLIEQVTVDGEIVWGDGCTNALVSKGRMGAALLKLAAGRARSLLFTYTANSFVSPERMRFEYRLEGHDVDWQRDERNLRLAVYTDLRPGPYEFRVRAFNAHGVMSPADARFPFYVAPHFYETWPFYVMCALTVSGLGGSMHWLRMRGMQRLKALEQQHALEQERARIARDMHDNLAADLTRLALAADAGQRQASDSDAAERWSKTGELARSLVDGIGELVWATNPRHNTLDALASYVRAHAAELLEQASLRCRFEFPDAVPPLHISGEARRHLFLAVKEALHNTLKHAQASEVVLSFDWQGQNLVLSVRDNGRGCEPTVATAPGHGKGGNGLRNLRERLEAIGGRCEFESSPGQGTSVRLVVPLAAPSASTL